MGDLETLKDEVFEKLATLELEELTELTKGLSIGVPLKRVGKKTAVHRTVMQHLMSEDVQAAQDEGRDLFALAETLMDAMLAKRLPVALEAEEVKAEGSGEGGVLKSGSGSSQNGKETIKKETSAEQSTSSNTNSSSSFAGTTTSASQMEQLASILLQQLTNNVKNEKKAEVKTEVRRLTDFKVNGVVGNGEGQLDYAAVMYKIRDGKKKGYRPAEIMSGVIAAMKPGSELRRYFESTPDVTEENFMQMLKGHYDIVNATKVLTELTNTWQEPTQGEREFFAKMLRLKNTLVVVAEEEKFHMTHDMIYGTFKEAVSVGMRNMAVRLEFQPILEKRLPDEQVAIELNKIVTRDKEHRKKMGEKNLKAQSNLLDVDTVNQGVPQITTSKEDIILAELKNLSADVKTLATVKEDVKILGGRMDGYDKRLDAMEKRMSAGGLNSSNPYKNKRYIKCEACEKDGKWCTHCSKCGEGDHKRKDCQKN